MLLPCSDDEAEYQVLVLISKLTLEKDKSSKLKVY
jgi:hypothetical protein